VLAVAKERESMRVLARSDSQTRCKVYDDIDVEDGPTEARDLEWRLGQADDVWCK